MKVSKTFIKDLLIIEPQLFKDERGSFYESYNKNKLDKVIDFVFGAEPPRKMCSMCYCKNDIGHFQT